MRFLPLLVLALACNGADDTDDTDNGTDTDNGSDTDTGTDTDTDTDAGTDDPGAVDLYAYSVAGCDSADTTLEGVQTAEDGHWSAAMFSPGEAVNIDEIRVHLYQGTLGTGTNCDASQAGQVEVYVTSSSTPPNNAEADAVLTVPSATVTGNERRLVLATDLDVGANENVFVAIQMAANTSYSTCVRTCANGGDSDENFWSNAETRPFSWQSFSDIGLDGTVQFMSIHGQAD